MSLSNLLIIFSSSFMALFPVINPLGNGFVVNGFFTDLDPQQRKAAIQKLTLNFIMIGVGTLVIGHLFLLIFGLAIPVIQLGGGILICKTAMELLGDSGSSDKEEASKNVDGFRWKNIEQKIFYPITFPISIGPGSISVIFTLMASASVKGKLLQTGINYLVIALVIIVWRPSFMYSFHKDRGLFRGWDRWEIKLLISLLLFHFLHRYSDFGDGYIPDIPSEYTLIER